MNLYDSPSNTIRDNTITTSSDAIKVDRSHLTIITGNTLHVASNGVSVSNSNQLTIDSNFFEANHHGVYLNNVGQNVVTNNEFMSMGQNAIQIDSGGWHTFAFNSINGGIDGIKVSAATAVSIHDNIILSNESGIFIQNSIGDGQCSGPEAFWVWKNTITAQDRGIKSNQNEKICYDENTITGIDPYPEIHAFDMNQDKNSIVKNNQMSIGYYGLAVSNSEGVTITGNTANDFRYSGIFVSKSLSITITDNTANDNGTEYHDYGGDGFYLSAGGVGGTTITTMTGNTANNNSHYGFNVDSFSEVTTFADNNVSGNTVKDFKGICQGSSCVTVSVDSLYIGQLGTKNGGDCDSVGTWVPTDLGYEGGTCTLSKDIQITGNGIGITLASSRVTLDGAGHTVTGTQTAGYDHVGVQTGNQYHTMAIKDLTITKFAYGIRSNNAVGLTVTGVTVTDVGKTAMSFGGSSRLIVEGNTIDVDIPNSWYGGMIVGVGHPFGNIATGSCTATDAMYDGSYQWAYQEDLILIKNNVITGAAIATEDGVGYCIDGNTINNNPGMNISYPNDQVSPTNHIIKNNVITGGGGFDIIGSGNTFDSNTVTGGSVGFHNYGTENIFTNNIANNNSQHGFKFEPDTTPVKFMGNTATGNGVSDFKGAPASCFASSGYSAMWTQDPDTSSRDVTFSGKLAPKQNDQCTLSDELFLDGKSVVVTATKDSVTKSVSGTTDNGFFNSLISFGADSDEGTWTITWFYAGDDLYPSTNEFGNGSTSFTLDVPAPPPNLPPTVNVPTAITLYTGTPSFTFAQSVINYNLYSGNTGPVFYPQPTASITGVSSEVVTFDVTATDNDLSSGPTCDVTSGSSIFSWNNNCNMYCN